MARLFTGIAFGLPEAANQPCQVVIEATGITVQVGGERRGGFTWSELQIQLTGTDNRYLALSGRSGLSVYLDDPGALEALRVIAPQGPVQEALLALDRSRSRRRAGQAAIVAVLLGLLVAVGLALWGGFLWVEGRVVAAVPPAWEVELGRLAARETLATAQICSEPAINQAMQELGSRLVGALGTTSYAYRLRVTDNEEVNAFALPGGYIFVHHGLIAEAHDTTEIAGVVAHELAHVQARHGIRNVVRQAGLSFALSAFLGDLGGLQGALASSAASFASMSFSREQEEAADRLAVELLRRARIDAGGLPRFLRRLAAEEGRLGKLLSIVSTHPASADRVRRLEELIAGPHEADRPLGADIKTIAGRCDPVALGDPDAP